MGSVQSHDVLGAEAEKNLSSIFLSSFSLNQFQLVFGRLPWMATESNPIPPLRGLVYVPLMKGLYPWYFLSLRKESPSGYQAQMNETLEVLRLGYNSDDVDLNIVLNTLMLGVDCLL